MNELCCQICAEHTLYLEQRVISCACAQAAEGARGELFDKRGERVGEAARRQQRRVPRNGAHRIGENLQGAGALCRSLRSISLLSCWHYNVLAILQLYRQHRRVPRKRCPLRMQHAAVRGRRRTRSLPTP